jgi:FkbM family methyltransferase
MLTKEEIRRIEITISCLDSSPIPKVANAGGIGVDEFGPFQLMHNGLKVTKDCYQGPWMTKVIELLDGHHEPQEEITFYKVLEILKKDSKNAHQKTILELGCFWGYYSMWFSKVIPDSRIVCVEPDPLHMVIGKQNFSRNRIQGHFINSQIGDKNEPNSTFICASDGVERKIETLTFSGVLDRADLQTIDLVHADIQGSEIALLLDLPNVLKSKKIRFILISTHDLSITGATTTHQDALQILKENGAFIITEHSVSESYSGDGLILASFFEEDREIEISISYNRSKNSLFGEWEPRMAAAQRDLNKIVNSKSWKLTAPLRKLRKFL